MLPPLRLVSAPESKPSTTHSGPIRIVLADDHPAMRRSLRVVLDGETDIDVVAETDSLQSMMRHMRASHPDVLVLDLDMSGRGSGIETLSRLTRYAHDTGIVVLTMNDEPAFARRALQNGALGLVLKELSDSDLPSAVREASHGRRYVSPRLADKLGHTSETHAQPTS
jgi:two-component system, NarL family, response regulator NreC